MTSITSHNTANTGNQVLPVQMVTSSSSTRKSIAGKNFISYTAMPKSWFRKPSESRVSFDWDLNKNELEFE